LGSGGFGKVVQVRKKDDNKIYAMKMVKKSRLKESTKRLQDIAHERAILQNECNFLVHLHFAFQTEDLLCFVLDYIPGGDLWFHLKRQKVGFPKKVVRFFAAEIVLALAYLHSSGVVYRDLKPENVLIDAEGHVCLTDFGISKVVGNEERTSSIVGTTCFMAPEVLKGEKYGTAVDWWSFGVLLYHMLTGRHPFYSSNKLETVEKIMTKRIHAYPGCPSKTGFDLLEKLLTRDPSQRITDPQLIKKHSFFKKTDWDKLLVKKVKPPFQIAVKGTHDLSYVEDEVKNTPIFTLRGDEETLDEDELYFPDFTMANPSVV